MASGWQTGRMRSLAPIRSLLAATAAVLLVAGCSSAIEGTGTSDGGAGPPTTGEPTETAEGSEPTETTEPTDDGGDDQSTLDCDGTNVVAPDGQPFCFDLPEGFEQQEIEIDNSAGAGAAYTTGAVLNERDVIVFSVYELNIDSEELGDQELADALAPIITQLGEQGFEFETIEPEIREVDDARAFFYTGSDATGLFSETYFIFRGFTELQVNCQWDTEQAALLAGCEQVLDSLELIG